MENIFENKNIETNTLNKNKKEEWRPIKFEDLVELYYFEALRRKRLTVERSFEAALKKVRDSLIGYTEDYLKNYGNDKPMETAEGALTGYFEDFHRDLLNSETENKPDELFYRINAFIMYVHERMRLNLGEELLGMSAEDFKALNYIDIEKPLDEQDKIMRDKVYEEMERHEK